MNYVYGFCSLWVNVSVCIIYYFFYILYFMIYIFWSFYVLRTCMFYVKRTFEGTSIEFFISPSIPSRKKTSYSRYHYLKTFISHRVNSSFVPFNTFFISTDPFSLVALKCMCGCCVAHNKKTENTKKMCCFLRALVLHLQHYLDPFSSTKR